MPSEEAEVFRKRRMWCEGEGEGDGDGDGDGALAGVCVAAAEEAEAREVPWPAFTARMSMGTEGGQGMREGGRVTVMSKAWPESTVEERATVRAGVLAESGVEAASVLLARMRRATKPIGDRSSAWLGDHRKRMELAQNTWSSLCERVVSTRGQQEGRLGRSKRTALVYRFLIHFPF